VAAAGWQGEGGLACILINKHVDCMPAKCSLNASVVSDCSHKQANMGSCLALWAAGCDVHVVYMTVMFV
jgi:hypothetical protein